MASLRSQGSDVEEGIALARQLSAGNSNGTNRDVLGQIQRGHPSTSFYDTKVGKCLLRMAHIVPIIWCANKITVDPFFLYIFVIDDDKKCFAFDKWISALSTMRLLGMVINVVSLGFVVMIMKLGLLKTRFEKIIWFILLLIDLSTHIVTYLPYEQALEVITVLSRNTGRPISYLANVLLVQYFGTLFLMYTTFIRATRMSATLAKATLAKAAFNLLLYIHGGHVFGGLWYALAIDKEIESWTKACKNDYYSFCSWDDFLCEDGYGPCGAVYYKTNNDSGIYSDAFKSGIVKESNVLEKLLYCLRWGLQNLSGFGQNLQVSTDVWENIFVISITIYGLVLFVFFIGNMQIYFQLKTKRLEKIRQKKKEIEISKSFAKLSKKLRKQIKRYQPDKWEETKDVHFENLFNNVPDDIKKNIKRELCLEILITVEEFRSWSDDMLDELCDCVKPVSYTQYAQIIRKNSSIDEMLFFVHGKLQTYSLVNENTDRSRISIDHLEDGMFCGEELIDWFRADPYSSSLPTSTRTIQTLTKVDAFALMSYDLQNLFIKHQAISASTQEQASPAQSQPQTPVESQSQPVGGI